MAKKAKPQPESARSLQARGFRPGRNECPKCGGEKAWYSKQCYKCAGMNIDIAARRKRLEAGDVPYALCGGAPRSKAKRDTGHRCLRPAGWRTPHPGVGLCYFHGGMMQNHLIHGARVMATVQMMDAEAAEAKRPKPKPRKGRPRNTRASKNSEPKKHETVGTKKVDVDAIIARHRAKKGKRKARS